MPRKGTFDPELVPLVWFGTDSVIEGWFDEDLIVFPAGLTRSRTVNAGAPSGQLTRAAVVNRPGGI